MSTDLHAELARAAGTPPPLDAGAVLGRVRSLRRRRRLATSTAVVALVAGLVALATGAAGLRVPGPVAGTVTPVGSVLAVPAQGEVALAHLDDGRPVFVAHHGDGTVDVFDAVSPHEPFGLGHLVGWCTSSGRFQDIVHGSVFNWAGAWLGGPAGRNLSGWAHEPDGEGQVRVVGDRPAEVRVDGVGTAQRGPTCFDYSEVDPLAFNPGTAEYHRFDHLQALSLAEALEAEPDTLVRIRGGVIGVWPDGDHPGSGRVVACLDPGATTLAACEGPPVVDGRTDHAEPHLERGDYLARVRDGQVADVIFLEGREPLLRG